MDKWSDNGFQIFLIFGGLLFRKSLWLLENITEEHCGEFTIQLSLHSGLFSVVIYNVLS